jgi:hypothetical protein
MTSWRVSPLPILVICLSACVTAAPGADKVRITKNPSDVSGCTAVGNVDTVGAPQGPSQIADSATELRNKTVGLGGNVIFVTSATLGVPEQGVAYRCPSEQAR